MSRVFTIGQIAKALRCHEQTARAYLHEVNANIDRYTSNLAEVVDQQTVLALGRRHADSITGRRLVPLLTPIPTRRR
jgi:hypothetical protein